MEPCMDQRHCSLKAERGGKGTGAERGGGKRTQLFFNLDPAESEGRNKGTGGRRNKGGGSKRSGLFDSVT